MMCNLNHTTKEAAMRNIKLKITVEMVETQDPVTAGNDPERMDDGSFSMVLDHAAEFDISRLENVMLRTTYPALRMTISEYLEDASKKKPMKN
jgi:hypothetical protein